LQENAGRGAAIPLTLSASPYLSLSGSQRFSLGLIGG